MLRRIAANPLGYIALLLASALLLSFTVAIADRGVLMLRIKQDESRLEYEVRQLEARNAALRAQREFYASDYYAERVAREDLGLVKPDDLSVIVVRRSPGDADASATTRAEAAAPRPAAPRATGQLERLRDWLLGQ